MKNLLFSGLGYLLLIVFLVIAIFLPKDFNELTEDEQETLLEMN